MSRKRLIIEKPPVTCSCCGYMAPEIDFWVTWDFGHMQCPSCHQEWWTESALELDWESRT